MTFGPDKRYPAGVITPLGANDLLSDRIPWMALRAYDDSIVFNLVGGLAICDPLAPERVELNESRGWIPPWKVIDQKGASQDGVSYVDALYDPIEIDLSVRAVGRDPAHLREVVRDLVASIDVKKEAELSVFTHYLGRWWAAVRWFKTPENPMGSIPVSVQELSLRLRADLGFWQSYPHVDQFRFGYADDEDTFDFVTAPGDPITGWTLAYSGAGSGVLYTDGAEAVSTLQSNRTVVARRTDFTATGDNVVVEIEMGTRPGGLGLFDFGWPAGTYVDVWTRMNNTGTAGTDGIRWRIGQWSVKLSSFAAGVETVLREQPLFFFDASPGRKFSFVTGVPGDPRTHKMMSGGATILTVKETGTNNIIDSSHRKGGFGQATLSGTVRPVALRNWKIGDNTEVAQEGFVERVNVGDQPMWDRYTCFGPGNFWFANGPGSTEFVKFGPLLPNQIMQVRTDPRKRGVVDMTAIPPTPQEIAMFQDASDDFFSFFLIFGNSIPTAQTAIASIFGIYPPQGNPYSLLSGRFSSPIPPRSPGAPVQPYFTKVKISEGNSDSQIIVAGTPLRRLPY